jgi:hypothetical protein
MLHFRLTPSGELSRHFRRSVLVQRFHGTTHIGSYPSPTQRLKVAAQQYEWFHGIAVLVSVPRELQDTMSRQAQAEREKDARVTLASTKREGYGAGGSSGAACRQPHALRLHRMNLLHELNTERGTTVLIPTDMANSLGAVVGLTQRVGPAS